MKNTIKVLAIISIICFLVVSVCTCGSAEKLIYYADKDNYISVTGIVESVINSSERSGLYIDFSDLNPSLDDTCFKIVGENLNIVRKNGIEEKLKEEDEVVFITAPRYFGDGYVMPIVAISINGESLLDFNDGYANLMNWLYDS